MRKPKLSRYAKAKIDLSSKLITQVLHAGGIPAIVIGSKVVNHQTSELEYFIVSQLNKQEVRYILSRLVGLLDGSIANNN